MGHRPPVEVDPSDLEDITAILAKAHDVCLDPLIVQLEQDEAYFRRYALTEAAAIAWGAARQALQNARDAKALILRAQKLLLEQHPERAE